MIPCTHHHEAATEILDAIRYYEGQREGLDVRRLRVVGFPYHVFYLYRENVVTIVSVCHVRRQPGHWADRVE